MNTQNKLIVGGVGAVLLALVIYGSVGSNGPMSFFDRHASSTPSSDNLFGEMIPVGEMVDEDTLPPLNNSSEEQPAQVKWSTYTNTKYHYSFTYPNGAILSTDTAVQLTTLPEAHTIHIYPPDTCNFPCYDVTVRIVRDMQGELVSDLSAMASSQRDTIVKDAKVREAVYTTGEIKTITFGGKDAREFYVNEQTMLKGTVMDWNTTYVLVEHLGKLLLFSYTPGNDDTTKILKSVSFSK